MSSASDDLPITLIASDGKEVRLSVKAAAYCEIIRNALNLDDDDDDDDHEPPAEGGGRDTVVPLKRVGSEELERIAEFLNYYAEHKMIPIADPLTGGPDSPIEEFLKPTWEENVPQEWYRNFANTLGAEYSAGFGSQHVTGAFCLLLQFRFAMHRSLTFLSALISLVSCIFQGRISLFCTRSEVLPTFCTSTT